MSPEGMCRLHWYATSSCLSYENLYSCDVKNHCVKWNEEFKFPCKMYASPVTGELEPCYCKVSIRKVIVP